MSNTRIRYSKVSDGSLVSMRVIKSNDGKEYRANILPGGLSGYVEDLSTGNRHPVESGSTHKLKIALKDILKAAGCEFEKETRGDT